MRKQTSGSTGIPLVIFIDEKVASFRSWRFRRPHFEAGEASPTSLEFLFPERFRRDKQVRVVGTSASGGKDVSTRTERSYSTLTDALKSSELIYNDLAGKSPATLIGYASSIVRLAEWMGSAHPLPSVKRIWTTSEMLTPDGREAIRRAFGFDPREAYASVEFGSWAGRPRPTAPSRWKPTAWCFRAKASAPADRPSPASLPASSSPISSTTPHRFSATTSAISPSCRSRRPIQRPATGRSRSCAARSPTRCATPPANASSRLPFSAA